VQLLAKQQWRHESLGCSSSSSGSGGVHRRTKRAVDPRTERRRTVEWQDAKAMLKSTSTMLAGMNVVDWKDLGKEAFNPQTAE